MTRPKVKFTKRLSVRLGLLSAVLATGGFAVAQPFFSADEAPKEAAAPKSPTITPIPFTDDLDAIAANATEVPANGLPQLPSQYDSQLPTGGLNMPSPAETVVRGNDGDVDVGDQPQFLPQPPASVRQVSGEQQDESAFVLPAAPQFDGVPASPRQPSQFEAQPVEAKALPDVSAYGGQDFQPPSVNQQPQQPTQISIGDQPAAASAYGNPTPAENGGGTFIPNATADVPTDANAYGSGLSAPSTLAPAAGLAPAAAATTARNIAGPGNQLPTQQTAPQASSQFEAPQAYGAPTTVADQAEQYGNQYGNAQTIQSPATPAVPAGNYGSPTAINSSPQASGQTAIAGSGTPGDQQLDGLQAPSVTLEKTAPAEIQVGKQATFELKVRNVGRVPAHDVIVIDQIPKGTRLVHSTPQPEAAPDGQLMWQLGTLPPGDEAVVKLQLMPLSEGEIGSVAQVVFQAKASVRTICTKPELAITQTGPQQVLIGQSVAFDITISNPGTGAATGVVLEEDVPVGLVHEESSHLELAVGTLKPGESRRLRLTLTADKPGIVNNDVLIRGEGNLLAKATAQVEVIAPGLQVGVSGPKLRYLERAATYEVEVANPGTAPAKEVEIVTYLPKGMKFLSADHEGHYEARNHAVYWSLEELPAKQSGVAKLKLMPMEAGVQPLTVEGRAELGLKHEFKTSVKVETSAELEFTIDDENDPVEVGSETVYAITLSNSGSSAATDIRMDVTIAGEMQPISGQGPTRVAVQGQIVSVEPLARLAPGEKVVYRLRVRGLREGNQRFQVQLRSAETPVPVTKEEITRIYADN